MSEEDLERVETPEDIQRVLELALEKRVEVYCDFQGHELPFVFRAIKGTNVVLGLWAPEGQPPPLLQTVLGSKVQAGVKVEAVFTLPDGQYALQYEVQNPTLTTFTLNAEKSLVRLQRRRDFRANVRPFGVKFRLVTGAEGQPTGAQGKAQPPAKKKTENTPDGAASSEADESLVLEVVDLSVGGMRVLWPSSLGVPTNRILNGTLLLPEGKTADVSARFVRNLGPQGARADAPFGVTYQFINASQDVSRVILFACMACLRRTYS